KPPARLPRYPARRRVPACAGLSHCRTRRPRRNPMSAPKKPRDRRTGLRMSATLATIFTILGHTVFGFEQSLAQVFVALPTGYACAILFEWVDARAYGRVPGFLGG